MRWGTSEEIFLYFYTGKCVGVQVWIYKSGYGEYFHGESFSPGQSHGLLLIVAADFSGELRGKAEFFLRMLEGTSLRAPCGEKVNEQEINDRARAGIPITPVSEFSSDTG